MKNMKRKALIVAVMALLLVAILAMSVSTFAKYTTTKNYTSGNAAVAKWGFVVSVQTGSMFSNAYGAKDVTVSKAVAYDDAVNVKASSAGTKVVAPGTTGEMTFSITGTAEVLSKIAITVNANDVALTYNDGVNPAQTYNPVKWTLMKETATPGTYAAVAGNENVTLATIESTLEGWSVSELAPLAPNTNFANAGNYKLVWTWAFSNASTGIDDEAANTVDEADTLLGSDLALPAKYTKATTLSFEMTIEITQIQK